MHNYAMISNQELGIVPLKQSRFAPTKSLEAWTKLEIPGWFKKPPVRLAALIIKLCVCQMYIQIINLICRAVTEQVLVIKYL